MVARGDLLLNAEVAARSRGAQARMRDGNPCRCVVGMCVWDETECITLQSH